MKIVLKIIIVACFVIFVSCSIPNQYIVLSKSMESGKIYLQGENETYELNDDMNQILKLTDMQIKQNQNKNEKYRKIKKLKDMGFSSEQIVKYLYPYMYYKIIEIINKESIDAQNAKIEVLSNTAKIQIKPPKNGIKINNNDVFNQIIYGICNKNTNIILKKNECLAKIQEENLKNIINLKSKFVTGFKNSTFERKNNIKIALSCFDGFELKPGEILSFNNVVGERSEEKGYKQAKVILNGQYVESFGGGVCQVSTTLYNAALLAGLEIVEVHSHSLRIGYIEPGFDAMVNMGSSDLQIKNNTGDVITIATSNDDDKCIVAIYGIENKYNYIRQSCCEVLTEFEEINDMIIVQNPSIATAKLIVYDDNNKIVDEKILRTVEYRALYKHTNQ